MKFILPLLLAVASLIYAGQPLAEGTEDTPPVARDINPGEALFERKCGQCHSLADGKNGNGPSLYGIVNRPAAMVPGFKYSRALRQMASDDELVWTEEEITLFLSRPSFLVPGTRMAFPGIADEKNLAVLVAWIKENSGPPSGSP